jgi:hypothetical protein
MWVLKISSNPSASIPRCSQRSQPWSNRITPNGCLRIRASISTRGKQPGLDHLGIQVESKDELTEVCARLRKAGGNVIEQGDTTCCYAKSEKSWIDDPAGIAWETFHTTGESTVYGDGSGEREARIAHEKSCCAPQVEAAPEAKAACCG